LVAGGGGSDANVFNARGCPAVVVGCGMEKPHSTEERIAVRALYELADLAAALVTA
jgi:tripeptide aminopeptidase